MRPDDVSAKPKESPEAEFIKEAREHLAKIEQAQEEHRKERIEAAKERLGGPRYKLGLASGTLAIEEYDPAWPAFFLLEKERLTELLGGEVVIEHVGSTAIPGMSAKPIIDIVVGFSSNRLVEKAIPKLIKAGYRYVPEANRRSHSKFFGKGQPRLYHVHLVQKGSIGWQNFLCFRNHLREHYQHREQYKKLKCDMAAELLAVDTDTARRKYAQRKADFINVVTMRAIRAMRYRRYNKFARASQHALQTKFDYVTRGGE